MTIFTEWSFAKEKPGDIVNYVATLEPSMRVKSFPDQ